MAETTCQSDLHELNALVAEFVCAYSCLRLESSRAKTGHAHRARVKTKQAKFQHAPQHEKSVTEAFTPINEDETEIVELPNQLPHSVSEPSEDYANAGTSSVCTLGSYAPVIPHSESGSPERSKSIAKTKIMSRSMDNLLAQQAFQPKKLSTESVETEFHQQVKQVWNRCMDVQGEEVLCKVVEPMMSMLIVLNCLLIGVSLDSPHWGGWVVIDGCFAGLYTIELFFKVYILGWREMYLGSGWRWSAFDTFIVVLAIVDLFLQANDFIIVFRLLRLVRLSHLLQMLNLPFLQELAMLVRGMAGGIKCLAWCICFLALPIFFTGMILSQVLKDWGDDGLFSTVPAAMFTTFRCMCNDCTDKRGRPLFVLVSQSRGWHFALMYSFFILVTTIGCFNLITALFIEVTMQVAKNDSLRQSQIRKAEDKKFAMNIKSLVYKIWVEYEDRRSGRHSATFKASIFSHEFAHFSMNDALDLEIGVSRYQDLVNKPHIREVLDDMGLEHDDIVNLFDMLDVDRSGSLDLKELVNGLHKLRGDAKKIDLVALSYMICCVEDGIEKLNAEVAQLRQAQLLPQGRGSSSTFVA